jgi:hypothetical protein
LAGDWQHGVKRSVRQQEGLVCDLFEPILAIVMDDADLKAIEAGAKMLRPVLGRLSSRAVTTGAATTSGSVMDNAEPDMYVYRATSESLWPAASNDLDFIAAARQDVPRLLSEIQRLRNSR